jgi:hypothetical protein
MKIAAVSDNIGLIEIRRSHHQTKPAQSAILKLSGITRLGRLLTLGIVALFSDTSAFASEENFLEPV